jgi:6-phosphogluconolactonase/glucosamine-6-phosphate isomerase/deaminase
MNLISTTNPVVVAGAELTKILASCADVPVLLLLSGGSAFSFLAEVSETVLDERITLGVLDERYDLDPAINNFAQLSQLSFFARAVEGGCSFIDTRVEAGESLVDMALRYDLAIKSWRRQNPEGVVVATLGLGIDGHTAGIMPDYVDGLATSSSAVVGYTVPASVSLYQNRVTISPRFFKEDIAAAMAFVVGEEKYPSLETVIAKEGEINDRPALLWHHIPTVTLVTTYQA